MSRYACRGGTPDRPGNEATSRIRQRYQPDGTGWILQCRTVCRAARKPLSATRGKPHRFLEEYARHLEQLWRCMNEKEGATPLTYTRYSRAEALCVVLLSLLFSRALVPRGTVNGIAELLSRAAKFTDSLAGRSVGSFDEPKVNARLGTASVEGCLSQGGRDNIGKRPCSPDMPLDDWILHQYRLRFWSDGRQQSLVVYPRLVNLSMICVCRTFVCVRPAPLL